MEPIQSVPQSQPHISKKYMVIPPVEEDLERPSPEVYDEFVNRMKDIKNRIELRRMLAQYEAGNLKPPIFYKDTGVDGNDYEEEPEQFVNENQNNHAEEYPPYFKRAQENQYAERRLPKVSAFRELSHERIIPKQAVKKNDAQQYSSEDTNELPVEPLKYKSSKGENSNEISPEAGVYTEGGLVFVPDSDTQGHSACMCGPIFTFSHNFT